MLDSKLNSDGQAELTASGNVVVMGANELDRLIRTLSDLRSQMSERVPQQQDRIETVALNPMYSVRLDKETKACLLSIRHPGLGWLNFELPTQEVLNMRTLWSGIVDKLDLEPPSGYYDGPERRRTKPH